MKKNGKRILVIDGQGGRLGRCLVESILARYPDCTVMAVGTNSTATAAMVKGGAEQAATGENPVLVACRRADVIVGPVGIVIADALHGEVTPKMAAAGCGCKGGSAFDSGQPVRQHRRRCARSFRGGDDRRDPAPDG